MKTGEILLQKGEIISLRIHGVGSSGEGIGTSETGLAIFVDGALPEETVLVKITEIKKNYAKGTLKEILHPSPHRVKPACPLFGKCGGCQLMHISYEAQLALKQQKVIDALTRIGKIENPPVHACIPSPLSLSYRNKIQLPVQGTQKRPILGLYAKSSHDLIEMDACLLHSSLGEQSFQAIKPLVQKSNIAPFNAKTNTGELRHILIKSAIATQEALVILVTNQKATPSLQKLADEILLKAPWIQGVIHNFHEEPDNVILGRKYTALAGKSNIQERLLDLRFTVSPASFFQVNPLQAENLYAAALRIANPTKEDIVLDAYCGVGTLSLVFARHVKHVIGVESVPNAIEDAKINAKQNGIANTSFFSAKTENWIKKQKNLSIDIALINPPRKGCDPAFVEGLKTLLPKKILYISCDPATLARDLISFEQMGYRLQSAHPFDMFPQTSHVECIAYLSLL